MPRKLLVLNALFLAIAALAAASIARQILTPRPLPGPGKATVAAAPAPQGETPAPPASAYAVVASRNLFSPSRTETPVDVGTAAPVVAKPNLYGVVLRQGKPSLAYIEDPVTKRVASYRIGEPVAGGVLRAIMRDSVTIERSDGKFDVALRDPAKPRPAPTTAAVPGVPLTTPVQPTLPGLPRPQATGQPPVTTVPRAQVVPPQDPATVDVPGAQGRRLPFNLMRRLPQPPTPGQAPTVTPPPGTPPAPPQGQQD